MNVSRKTLQKLALFALAGSVLLLWVLLRLPCIPRALTGIICPGCGMGRAWLAFLHGMFSEAFFYHPMFWCVPILVLFGWFEGRLFRNPRINQRVLWSLTGGLLVCYLIRLVCFLDGSLVI